MIDPAFDGHQTCDFSKMTAEERLEDLSRKIALVLELRNTVTVKSSLSAGVLP